jgi:hypothetical protein
MRRDDELGLPDKGIIEIYACDRGWRRW